MTLSIKSGKYIQFLTSSQGEQRALECDPRGLSGSGRAHCHAIDSPYNFAAQVLH